MYLMMQVYIKFLMRIADARVIQVTRTPHGRCCLHAAAASEQYSLLDEMLRRLNDDSLLQATDDLGKTSVSEASRVPPYPTLFYFKIQRISTILYCTVLFFLLAAGRGKRTRGTPQ